MVSISHCQYSRIELIWTQFQRKVAEKNSTFKIADVEALVNKDIDAVNNDDPAIWGEHFANLQEEDFHKSKNEGRNIRNNSFKYLSRR